MKERPILFSGEMVRAILDGRKTQTRRVIKPDPDKARYNELIGGREVNMTTFTKVIQWNGHDFSVYGDWHEDLRQLIPYCPYGRSGDRLWIRETHYPTNGIILYKADNQCEVAKWTPSIHMRREYSRINLEITNIRVERLQDISEEDAKAEGCDNSKSEAALECGWYEKPRRAYQRLWEKINNSGSWDKNPWVWVVEFRRVS